VGAVADGAVPQFGKMGAIVAAQTAVETILKKKKLHAIALNKSQTSAADETNWRSFVNALDCAKQP